MVFIIMIAALLAWEVAISSEQCYMFT
jgi:hypothetical protein